MVNLGFRDLIEKLEEYFGRTASKALVGIAAVSVMIFVVGYAVQNSIYPLVLWVGGVLSGNPALSSATQSINWLVTAIWIVLVVAMIVTIVQFRLQFWNTIETHDRAQRVVSSVEHFRDELQRLLREYPDEAGPHVIEMLNRLTAEDAKKAENARKKFHPLSSRSPPSSGPPA